MYDMLREVRQTWATIRDYNRQGRKEDAEALFQENKETLRFRKMLEKAQKNLRSLRKQMDRVQRSDLSGAEKRKQLDALQVQVNTISRRVVNAATTGR